MGTTLVILLSEVAWNTSSSIAACRAGVGSEALQAGMRGRGTASEMGFEGCIGWRWRGKKGEAGRKEHNSSGAGSRCTGRTAVQGCTPPKGKVIHEAGGGPRWLSLMKALEVLNKAVRENGRCLSVRLEIPHSYYPRSLCDLGHVARPL